MSSTHVKHFGVAICLLAVLAILPQACGGGGGSDPSASTGPPSTNPGQVGSGTPNPVGTGTPQTPVATPVVLRGGADVAQAIRRVPAGSTIILSPGAYGPINVTAGVADGITVLGDPTAMLAGGTRGPISIIGGTANAAISINGVTDIVFDSITVSGGMEAGILVVDSPGTWIQDCVVRSSAGAGIKYVDSDDGLIFNDLIWKNAGAGIAVLGSNNPEMYNDTSYKNAGDGILVTDDGALVPVLSSGITAENNIINKNTPAGISVSASTTDFAGNFNYNSDGYDGVTMGPDDIDTSISNDPLFVAPGRNDDGFHLQVGVNLSTSPAIDAGDPNTPADLLAVLEQLTTQLDGTLDTDPVDLGYHYLPPSAFATPTPPETPTHTPRGTPTRTSTPTRTPTRTP